MIKFNPSVLAQFDEFRARHDTFSLGVCNGCQFLALLGWIPQLGPGNENGNIACFVLFSNRASDDYLQSLDR